MRKRDRDVRSARAQHVNDRARHQSFANGRRMHPDERTAIGSSSPGLQTLHGDCAPAQTRRNLPVENARDPSDRSYRTQRTLIQTLLESNGHERAWSYFGMLSGASTWTSELPAEGGRAPACEQGQPRSCTSTGGHALVLRFWSSPG